MAQPDTLAPLYAALAKFGVTVIDADKAKMESAIESWADGDANAVIGAIAAHINLNGMAGMVQNPLRNSITGAEPAIDKVINDNINGGFDQLEATLTKLASS